MSFLPAGRDIDLYKLPVHLKVYDYLNAFSQDTTYVIVYTDPLMNINFGKLLHSVELSADPANILNMYAISVVALTRVRCDASPVCSSHHRCVFSYVISYVNNVKMIF